MFLVPPSQSSQHHASSVGHCASLSRAPEHQLKRSTPGAILGKLPKTPDSHMERNIHEYSQSDHASAAQYPNNQEARPTSYSTSATPTSEYGTYPPSARSTSSFPEHSIRQYHPASNHNGSSGGMAQQPTNNPSIAAPSPPYPHGQYSPYAQPPQDMAHSYSQGAPAGIYTQPRPDWANYGHPAGQMPHHPVSYSHPPTSAPPGRPAQYGVQQVYSFVPIPGAQQHKRPRRRYEEIERMYKCGWNGCEKAYGTLNHLNAHVTMQSHGQKRTPEEFKEIRKEWKARKKEEEQQRKAVEEQDRQRHAQAAAAQAQNGGADPQGSEAGQPTPPYASRQLPPISYAPPYPPSTGSVPQQALAQYNGGGHMYAENYQANSPYAGQNQQMYNRE